MLNSFFNYQPSRIPILTTMYLSGLKKNQLLQNVSVATCKNVVKADASDKAIIELLPYVANKVAAKRDTSTSE